MSKGVFITIIVVAFLIVGGIFASLFFKTGPGGVATTTPSIRNLFPFGGGTKTDAPTNGEQPATNTGTVPTDTLPFEATALPRLIKLTTRPVAGFIVIDKLRKKAGLEDLALETSTPATVPKNTKTTAPVIPAGMELARAIRYADSTTGNIYDIFIDTLDERRITNTTIPRIQEAFFTDMGKNVILRYLDDDGQTIESYIATLPEEVAGGDSEGSLSGTFLDKNIFDMRVSPDTKNIFSLTRSAAGTVGTLSDAKMGNGKQIFSSAFIGWRPEFVNTKMISLATKASGRFDGYLYALDPSTNTFEKILDGGGGFMGKVSPNGKKVVFDLRSGNTVVLRSFDRDSGVFKDLQMNTLVDKCVWATDNVTLFCGMPSYFPTGVYPDDWYMGMVSFTDTIWQIDLTGSFENLMVADPFAAIGDAVDATHLSLDSDNRHLFFTDKKSRALYMYSI